ncbi:uncharacterized protein VTP21DRAFT_891 [Calcarisporiella thermophila]|uniref:uncharacterized protein n=1 Tax=Calcarisporiella thermophila TaxID=911321 RepID=UPI0037449217
MTSVVETEKKLQRYDKNHDRSAMVNLCVSWVNYKGAWVTTIILIICLKAFFGIIPGISPEASWTLTNLAYNMGSFIMFHGVEGVPFENHQGAYDDLTLWEQIDNEAQFTPARKFLTATPIVLFLLSTHYTHYDLLTFMINFTALCIVLVAKLPAMHRVRPFGSLFGTPILSTE